MAPAGQHVPALLFLLWSRVGWPCKVTTSRPVSLFQVRRPGTVFQPHRSASKEQTLKDSGRKKQMLLGGHQVGREAPQPSKGRGALEGTPRWARLGTLFFMVPSLLCTCGALALRCVGHTHGRSGGKHGSSL